MDAGADELTAAKLPQHGRDHLVTGSDPIPSKYFAIHLYDQTAQSVASGNDIRVAFASHSTYDTSVFGVTTSGGSVVQIKALKQGWYSLFAQVDWASTLSAGSTVLQFLNPGDSQDAYGISHTNASITHVGLRPLISLTRYCPNTLGFADSLPTTFELWLAQSSGGAVNTNLVSWDMVYLGDSDY